VKTATGASTAQLGLALFAVGLAALPAMALSGRVADRAFMLPATLVLFGAAGALPAVARSPGALFACLLAVGATSGALDVAANARASAVETRYGVRIMDGVHAAFSAGVLVGGVSTGLLRNAGAHPEWVLLGIGALLVVTAVANRAPIRVSGVARDATLNRRLLGVGAILALAFVLEGGLESWSSVFLERGLDTSPAVSGLGPGSFAAAMTTGRLLAQHVAETPPTMRILAAGLLAACGVGLAAVAMHAAVAILGFVIAGIGLAVAAPTLLGAAGRIGRGAAISTVVTVGYVGFLVGPALFGGVAGATGLRGGFVLLVGVAVLLALGSLALPRLLRDSRS
jgi:MFS transporter